VILLLSLASSAISAAYIAVKAHRIHKGYQESKQKVEEFYNVYNHTPGTWGSITVYFEWDNPDDVKSELQCATLYYGDGSKSIRSYYLSDIGEYPILASDNYVESKMITVIR
jgi:hypothetical protein